MSNGLIPVFLVYDGGFHLVAFGVFREAAVSIARETVRGDKVTHPCLVVRVRVSHCRHVGKHRVIVAQVHELAKNWHSRPCALSVLHRGEVRRTVVTADPDTARQHGRVANEPRVGMVVGGAGLACQWEGETILADEAASRTMLHHTAHQAHRLVRQQLAHGLVRFGLRLKQDIVVLIANLLNEIGFDVNALIGETVDGAHLLIQSQLTGTETDRRNFGNR